MTTPWPRRSRRARRGRDRRLQPGADQRQAGLSPAVRDRRSEPPCWNRCHLRAGGVLKQDVECRLGHFRAFGLVHHVVPQVVAAHLVKSEAGRGARRSESGSCSKAGADGAPFNCQHTEIVGDGVTADRLDECRQLAAPPHSSSGARRSSAASSTFTNMSGLGTRRRPHRPTDPATSLRRAVDIPCQLINPLGQRRIDTLSAEPLSDRLGRQTAEVDDLAASPNEQLDARRAHRRRGGRPRGNDLDPSWRLHSDRGECAHRPRRGDSPCRGPTRCPSRSSIGGGFGQRTISRTTLASDRDLMSRCNSSSLLVVNAFQNAAMPDPTFTPSLDFTASSSSSANALARSRANAPAGLHRCAASRSPEPLPRRPGVAVEAIVAAKPCPNSAFCSGAVVEVAHPLEPDEERRRRYDAVLPATPCPYQNPNHR